MSLSSGRPITTTSTFQLPLPTSGLEIHSCSCDPPNFICTPPPPPTALLTTAAESWHRPWRRLPLPLRQGIAHCVKKSQPHHNRHKLSGDVRRRQAAALSTSGGPTGNDGEGTEASGNKTPDAGSTDAAEGPGDTSPPGDERARTHASGPVDWEQMAARIREAWGDQVEDEELPEPGAGEEYDEREMALQSMLYPGMVPTNEELLDQSHVPVIQDPWQNKGRFHR